jgi:hypothetical protein
VIALLIGAAILDAATMLALPKGAELNPFAASLPLLAVGAKLIAAGAIAYLYLHRVRYFAGVATFGTLAWSVGAASNLRVIL